MDEKLIYLEARVNILESLILKKGNYLETYIDALKKLQENSNEFTSDALREEFQKHFQQLSLLLEEKEKDNNKAL
uniref:Uncharacterized protein n=1 Tax=Myoviridae sp. ctOoC8 TaxID=2823542 RepID=A0A8S5L6A6_9CAUD|nr:MAG TPA: hypothetical protein [Myoviridae sp. ctOoC8]